MYGVHVENNVPVLNGHSIKSAVFLSTFRIIGTRVADCYLQLLVQVVLVLLALQVPLVPGELSPWEVRLSVAADLHMAVAGDPETVAEVDQ